MTELIQSDLQQSPLSAFLQEFPDLPIQRRFRMQSGGRIHLVGNTVVVISYYDHKRLSILIIQHFRPGTDPVVGASVTHPVFPGLVHIFPGNSLQESPPEILKIIRMDRSF